MRGKQGGGAGVARAGGGEVGRHGQRDHRDPQRAGEILAAVGRSRIDVDHRPRAHDRTQARLQPLALVAADHHDADGRVQPRHAVKP